MALLKELFNHSIRKKGVCMDMLTPEKSDNKSMNNQPKNNETKAIDPLDTEREWSDEELEEFTETDVKFALGSSTPGMRELLRAKPNEVNE